MNRDSGSKPYRATTTKIGVVHESRGADRQSPNTFVSSPSMTIKEMTERVARAIFDSHNSTYTMGGPARWESDPEHWRRYAQAAIDVIGSPESVTVTDEMLDAAREAGPPILRGVADCELRDIIDAALLKVALQL